MKKYIANFIYIGTLSLVVVLWTSGASYAQRSKSLTAEQRAEKAVKLMSKNLGLNLGQIAKVEEVNLVFQRARETAKANQDQTAIRAARKAYYAELKTILTRDQYKKFKQTQRN